MLRKLAETGDALYQQGQVGVITPFHSAQVPDISIEWYFILLAINSGLCEEQTASVLILIERLCNMAFMQQNPIVFNSLTAHR